MIWVEYPKKVNTSVMHHEALKKNIMFFPGQSYSVRSQNHNCLALSIGNRWSETIDDAVKTLGDLAKKQLTEKK
jgi:DNA-binding transcriptional MocR family regulator